MRYTVADRARCSSSGLYWKRTMNFERGVTRFASPRSDDVDHARVTELMVSSVPAAWR